MKKPGVVYSTGQGRMCPECGKPAGECACPARKTVRAGDGGVRVRRETKGRGGKTVTTITGIPLDDSELRELGTELRRTLGTGGSVHDGVIEIQGDHVERVLGELLKRGYKPKRAGG